MIKGLKINSKNPILFQCIQIACSRVELKIMSINLSKLFFNRYWKQDKTKVDEIKKG